MRTITLLHKLKMFTGIVMRSVIFLFIISCEDKNYTPPENNGQSIGNGQSIDKDQASIDTPSTDLPIQSDTEILTAGESNIIELKNVKNKKYIIKSGTYSGIKLTNIQNTIIEGLNNVKIINANNRNDIVGIIIESSDGLTIKGISIEDYKQPAIVIKASANNLILENLNLK